MNKYPIAKMNFWQTIKVLGSIFEILPSLIAWMFKCHWVFNSWKLHHYKSIFSRNALFSEREATQKTCRHLLPLLWIWWSFLPPKLFNKRLFLCGSTLQVPSFTSWRKKDKIGKTSNLFWSPYIVKMEIWIHFGLS